MWRKLLHNLTVHRWVAKGISRANTDEHQGDLERLRVFFGLSSVGEFWLEASEMNLAERLRRAGEISWEYEYAYKVLVILTSKRQLEARQICKVFDDLFAEETQYKTPEDTLKPKTPEQIVAYLRLNRPDVFEELNGCLEGGDGKTVADIVRDVFVANKKDADKTLDRILHGVVLKLSQSES